MLPFAKAQVAREFVHRSLVHTSQSFSNCSDASVTLWSPSSVNDSLMKVTVESLKHLNDCETLANVDQGTTNYVTVYGLYSHSRVCAELMH